MPDNKLMKSALELQSALDTRPCAKVAEAIEAASRVERSMADTLRAIEDNSGIKQMLESVKQHEMAMRTAFGPIEELRRMTVFDVDSPGRREMELVLESVKRHEAAMRTAFGPIEELRRVGVFDFDSPWLREMELVRQAITDFEARFRLPEIPEAARLILEFTASPLSESLARYAEQASSIQRAMESMRTPWLDPQEAMRSMAGFAELQGIGSALVNMPSFGDSLASALRIDLGDWRDPITWRPEMFTDLVVRSDFYVGLGFDVALTDFPALAFGQSLDIAGLRREPPALVDRYGAPVPRLNDDDEEEGLARTNMAHDWLLRLETQLREFIDERMTKAFGADWPKRRLPNGLYEAWQEKKRKAKEAGGREWPLVAYADFTDYERVICRSDNWREIFAAFFGRPERVRESFQRLYPIRLDTMHSRPITQDDELLLYVETRRLVKVIIGRRS